MSDISHEQIASEFKRQVRLCAGIGRVEMLNIIDENEWVGVNSPFISEPFDPDKHLGKEWEKVNAPELEYDFWCNQTNDLYVWKEGEMRLYSLGPESNQGPLCYVGPIPTLADWQTLERLLVKSEKT